MAMATKLGRVGIYNQELPSIKSKGPLIRWSQKVMWKIRSIISQLYLHKVYGYQTWQGCDLLWGASTHNVTKRFKQGHVRSIDKLKAYFHYWKPAATKPGRVVTYNEELPSIKSHDPLITKPIKVWWQIICYISTTAIATATNYNRVVTYIEELSSVGSQDLLITWSYKVTWQFE